MEKSDWRKYLKQTDDPVEKKRFTTEFYACVVDPDGKPYFVPGGIKRNEHQTKNARRRDTAQAL
jgi:hypothetical protein